MRLSALPCPHSLRQHLHSFSQLLHSFSLLSRRGHHRLLEADVRGAVFSLEGAPCVWEGETGADGRVSNPYSCNAGCILKV